MPVRRIAFCVLVIPYAPDAFAEMAFALRRERDGDGVWHAPAGDGLRGECAEDAARRVAGAPAAAPLLALDSRATLAVEGCACGLAEHAFAVRADPDALVVPVAEQQLWVSYRVAEGLLQRPAERNALWELGRRLGMPRVCR